MIPAPLAKDEPGRLLALEQYAIVDTPPEPGFDALARLAARIMDVPIALISFFTHDRQWFKASYGLDVADTPRELSFCGHVVAAGESMVVDDARSDHRFFDNPMVLGEPWVRFYAGVPLRSDDDHVLGALCAVDRQPRQSSPEQLELLGMLARQVSDQLELRRQQATIQASLARQRVYRNYFELSLNLLCTVDAELYFRELNPRWEEVLGWSTSHLRGTRVPELLHPDDRERTEREAARLLRETGIVIDFKSRYRHEDGHYVWLTWSATMSEGTFYAAAVDVSEQQRVEEALHESEARMRAIIDSTVDAIITIDEQGLIQAINPATERSFGYRAAELLGMEIFRLVPAGFAALHDVDPATGEARVVGRGYEAEGVRQDGSVFPIELSIGEVGLVGRRTFTGIIRDITDRKAAGQRIQDTMRDLRKSRDDLLATFNQLRIGTVIIDADERIAFISASCGSLPWIDPAASVGRRWQEVLALDPRDRRSFRVMMQRREEVRERLTLSWQSPETRPYWVEADIKDDARDPTARIAFFYDVSEVNELRSRLLSVNRRRMVGMSESMRQVHERVAEVAAGTWTVLIEGETGVGKELVARAIHDASRRRRGPFIAVNCAGLTDSLLESRLFGHRKGAFTGAISDQKGLFEAADGGTLLLDEIGDISPKLQTALLRALQEREVIRVGDARARRVDVRILAATNRNLSREVSAGRFRADLLYRLRVARIKIPPLRERLEDIPLLANAFLEQQRHSAEPIVGLSPAALQALHSHEWPGNVRELESAIEHAVIRCKSDVIRLGDLPPEIRDAAREERASPASLPTQVAKEPEDSSPRAEILAALEWADGNRTRAARRLGISRATLYRRLRELDIPSKKPTS